MRPTGPGEDRTIPAKRAPFEEDAEAAAWRRDAARTRSRHRRGRPLSRTGRLVRGITGSLAAGSLVLALALTGTHVWALNNGEEGPGPVSLIAHFLAAAIAVGLQVLADRRRDGTAGLALVGVVVVVFGSLWYWWWA